MVNLDFEKVKQTVIEDGVNIDEVMQKAYKNCKVVEDDCEIYL